ncbi:MAG TPA: phasin family protein [Gemmatimonadaceae bacterium]|nr:phasin family protein [Gemmatimonadaceae bacterium]
MARTTRKQNAPMLRDSVEQIWLAGLGALAITEDEGSKLFKTLVKRGEGFERTTKARLDEVVASARQVPSTAMNRIEETFDDTMTGVMHRIGVPTKREINGLARRVEGLAASIERQSAPPRRRARTKSGTTRRKASTPPS